MKQHVLDHLKFLRFSPISALHNLAYYASRAGDITADDAATLFDEWSGETFYPPEKRSKIIEQLKVEIIGAHSNGR
jgi:hypothetical protein